MKNFIALVEMGGKHVGKIAQHSIVASSLKDAKVGASQRFNRCFVVVPLKKGLLSLTSQEAEKVYSKLKTKK